MGTYVVEERIEDGRVLLGLLRNARFGVRTAMWLFMSEEGEWRLVIATPLVDRQGPSGAYKELQRVLKGAGININLRNISLVSPSAPWVRRYRNIAVHLGKSSGGTWVSQDRSNDAVSEEAYLYSVS